MTAVAPWRSLLFDDVQPKLPAGLDLLLDAERVIILEVRYSTPSGKKAITQVIQNLHVTVDLLKEISNLSVAHLVPPDGEIAERLRAAHAHQSRDQDGNPFTNKYVVYDFAKQAQVVFLISIGSGSKIDEELRQPFVVKSARVYLKYNGCLLFANRSDRTGRVDWGLGPIMTAIQATDGYLGDDSGIRPYSDSEGVATFLKGSQSRREAEKYPNQTRTGQLSKTDKKMSNGQAIYHGPTPPPPGFGRVTLRTGVSAKTKIIYLDTARYRPPSASVAFGLPQLVDAQGNPIDQVEVVRWVLAHFAKPEWDLHEIHNELVNRHFSTTALRERADDASAVTTQDNAPWMLHSILNNLDVYETGVLQRALGADVEAIKITDCYPLGGKWAEEEDFARIRAHLETGSTRYQGRRSLTLASVSGTYDGDRFRLQTAQPRPDRPPSPPRYRYLFIDPHPRRRHIFVPATVLHTSIVEGIRSAGDRALVLVADSPNPAVSALQAQIADLSTQLQDAGARLNTIMEHVTNPATSPTGSLFAALQREYDILEQERIPDLQDRIHKTGVTLNEARRNTPHAPHKQLIQLVATLNDAEDKTHNRLWIDTIANLAFTTKTDQHGRRFVQWTGQLIIGDGHSAYPIDFQGAYQPALVPSETHGDQPGILDMHIDALREGNPFPDTTLPLKSRMRRPIAERLSIPTTHPLFAINDPTILRVLTACLEQPDTDNDTIAARLTVDTRLVTRIRAVHPADSESRWNTKRERPVALLHALAATNGGHVTATRVADAANTTPRVIWTAMHQLRSHGWPWQTLRKRGYQLEACQCGSYRRAPLTIPEPDGPVCLDCRRDLSGIIWPSDPYDTYIAYPKLWRLQDSPRENARDNKPLQSA